MARRPLYPQATSWRDLVVHPTPEQLTRGVLPVWTWRFLKGTPGLLIPKTPGTKPVAFYTLEDGKCSNTIPLEVVWSSVPKTSVRLHWDGGTEERELANGYVLCCAAAEVLTPEFLSKPLPPLYSKHLKADSTPPRIVEKPTADPRSKRRQLTWDF